MTDKEIYESYPNNEYQIVTIGKQPYAGMTPDDENNKSRFAVCSWRDNDGYRCKKSEARSTCIVIYDNDGNRLDLIISNS